MSQKEIEKTLNYYLISNSDDSIVMYDDFFKNLYDQSPTLEKRTREGKGKSRTRIVENIRQTSFGISIVLATCEAGYRPKKAQYNLQNSSLSPTNLDLDANEELVDMVHLVVRQNHAILEGAQYKSIAKFFTWWSQEKIAKTPQIFFDPVTNRDVLAEINKHGVKSINMNVISSGIGKGDKHDFFSTIGEKLEKLDAKNGKLEIKPNKGKLLDVSESVNVYHEMKNSDNEINLTFNLSNGTSINDHELKLNKKVKVRDAGAKNADSEHMFELMQETYWEWVKNDYIIDDKVVERS